jgi:hypothetical protein
VAIGTWSRMSTMSGTTADHQTLIPSTILIITSSTVRSTNRLIRATGSLWTNYTVRRHRLAGGYTAVWEGGRSIPEAQAGGGWLRTWIGQYTLYFTIYSNSRPIGNTREGGQTRPTRVSQETECLEIVHFPCL